MTKKPISKKSSKPITKAKTVSKPKAKTTAKKVSRPKKMDVEDQTVQSQFADDGAQTEQQVAQDVLDNSQVTMGDQVGQGEPDSSQGDVVYEDSGQNDDNSDAIETIKGVFSSTTVWGIIISATSKISVLLFGQEIDHGAYAELINFGTFYGPLSIGFIGDVIAARGRFKASKQLVFRRVVKK